MRETEMSKKSSNEIRRSKKSIGRYGAILQEIFLRHFEPGCKSFEFERQEMEKVAGDIGIVLPKNLGDLLYSFRFRSNLPSSISETARKGREWVIELAGPGRYRFRLARINRIVPTEDLYRIKIPDATPEIIAHYAASDEQALLAKVRYNRLIDIFLRITAYSLQNHLRTQIPEIGQIEIDELYVGIRNTGQQFIVPVQAKGGNDQISDTQVAQDLEFCKRRFPALTPRLVAVQFVASDVIVMFELTFQKDDLKVIDEKQYILVSASQVTDEDLSTMARTSD